MTAAWDLDYPSTVDDLDRDLCDFCGTFRCLVRFSGCPGEGFIKELHRTTTGTTVGIKRDALARIIFSTVCTQQ